MNTDQKMNKYTVKFTMSAEVDADGPEEAVLKAAGVVSWEDVVVYVNGELY